MKRLLPILALILSQSIAMPVAAQADDAAALKAKVSAMEIEMQQMQALVGEALEQAQGGYSASNASRVEVEALNQKLRAALEESQQHSLKRIEERAVIQRYKSENVSLDADLAKLKEELEQARTETQRLRADLAGANIARTEIETEMLDQKQLVAEANDVAVRQGEQLTATQQETQQELQRLKDALATAEAERINIVAELDEQRKLAEEKSVQEATLDAELTEVRKQLTATAMGVEGQQQEIEETLATALAQEEELAAARRQVVELRDGLANAQTNIRNLQAEVDGFASAIEANVKQLLDAATAQLKSDVTSVSMRLQTTVEEIGELSATGDEAKIQTGN